MRYQFYYYTKFTEKLLNFLTETRIKHQVYDNGYVKFSLYSSQPDHQNLLDTLTSVYHCPKPLVDCDYTAKERNEAEFLWLTPCKYCIEITNKEDAYQYACAYEHTPTHTQRVHHKKQIGTFQIAKVPNLNTKTAFFAPDTGSNELFADHRIKALAEEHHLQGLTFLPLLLKNGQESPDIFQLTSQHVFGLSAVGRGYGETSDFCPLCGKEALVAASAYQMHLERSQLNPTLDLMVSDSFWGEGITYSVQIISQRFYKLLQQEKLTGSLRIDPIVLHG